MFFVSRVSDAIFDVVMGMTADRTRTRWGRFRPYLLWMAIPLAVAAVLDGRRLYAPHTVMICTAWVSLSN